MKNIFTRLWVVSLLLLVTATVSAQQLTELEVGAVYRFVNRGTGRALNAGKDSNGALFVNAIDVSTTDIKQQWYVTKEGDHYVLRNLEYAKYLKGAITNKVPWSLTDYYTETSNKFNLAASSTTWNTLETVGWTDYGFMHDDGNDYNDGKRVVSWENEGANNSHWTVTKVEYTADDLKTILDAHPTVAEVVEKRTANFVSLFNEGACCTPKYSSLAEAQATTEYQALETELQTLATNIYNKALTADGWAEKTVDPADRPNGNNSDNVPDSMWTVEDTWGDAYARKFRVQMYEPYSVEGEITTFLGFNAHCNMDNPTGIYANAGETIYIMVEGDIAEGAELWVAHQTGHGVTNYYNNAAYTELKKGLNVITYNSDGCQLWINYLVHTYNTSTGEFPHKLSDYKPLKIHIEGGHINGFFNAMGDFRSTEVTGDANGGENLWGEVDNDADWDYYKARAALATDFALLGHRQTLLFPFGTWDSTNGYFGVANDGGGIEKALAWHLENIEVPTTPNCYAGSGNDFGDFSDTYYPGMNLDAETGKINIMLEAWDRIMYSEHATMGLLSKSNIDKMNSLYPGWTAKNTTFDIYNYGSNDTDDTYKAFCEGRDYSDYYNHHGAAVGAASGYMSGGWRVCNYHYNTMGSIIGKIAVEAGPTWGPAHEIGHQHQAIFNLNGQTEVTNNFFSNVAVWYMGMGTSRVDGTSGSLASVLDAFNTEDNDLYTNNIWAITHLYYRLWLYYHLAGNNTQFWPRLFELLRQTPMANGAQISGETSLLRFYQHACDAAGEDLTEFFRAHGFFELMTNRLVGDYSNAIYNVTEEEIGTAIKAVKEKNYPVNYAVLLINDGTSETTLMHDGITKRALWDSSASAEYGSVNDFIEGNTSVTEAYTAIVGNDGTVTMSGGEGGVGFLVFNENGELISFSNKSTFELSDEAKKIIMQGNATFVAVDSENNTTTAEIDLTEMQKTILGELIAKAQQIIDKIDDTYTKIGFYKGAAVADLAAALENAKTVYDAGTSGYGAAYDLLYAEYQEVLENPDARIPFDPSLTYIITNKAYTNETMWVNDELVVRSEGGVDQTADAAKWQFKATESDGVYNIYNKKGYYCPAVAQSTKMTATATANADALYTLQEMEAGVWAIKLSPAAGYRNFHSSWSDVVGWETGSNASRWYLTAVEPNATIADLTELEVYITKTEALLGEVLGTVTYTRGENIALQTTTESDPYYIWSNAPCATEGAITNLVDGATNNYFHTEWNGDAVTSGDHYIAVDLGADNTLPRFAFSHTTRSGAENDFPKSVDIYGSDDNVTYKYLGSASDMPQSAGTFWQFDDMIISSHRYLRFNMHANRGYWHMAEFDIMPVTSFTATVNDTYSSTVTVDTIQSAMDALYNGKSVALSMAPTEADIDAKLEVLIPAYKALYSQYEATIKARKETLAQLVTNTQELIEQVGTVEIIPTIEAKLQTTEPDGDFYVSTNAQSSQEGPIANLVDGDNSTYFHSDYSGNDSSDALDHYINIKLGEANATKLFKFSYVTRHDAETNYPTAMTVYGSTNGTDYEMITSFTDLPASKTTTYGPVLIEECSKEYTYLRFMVTENSSGTDKGGHPFFHMAEFDLTTIGSTTTTVYSTYKSVVSEGLLLASVHTTNSSAAMSTNELVTSVPMLDAQIADQQAAYDKLKEAMQQATCDKTELNNLIEATTLLKGQLYETVITSYETESVTLQNTAEGTAGYLYCNAPGTTNNYTGDNLGVGALLDNDTSNFLHTTYNGDNNVDGLDHYLRVDLGDGGAAEYIQFRYTGRSEHAALTPKTAVVEAANNLNGDWTTIATLRDLSQTTNEVSTDCLGNGNAYRYWRFMVTETYDTRECDGHPYYALSAFNVYKCTNVELNEQLKYTPTIYIHTTADLVTEVENAITAATVVVDNVDATQGDVDAEVEALQAVYDKLAEALKYAGLPVTITTDEANPVLYKIISKRADDSSKVLQFDEPTTNKVAIVATADNASYQAWYFMKGDNGYLIKPFNGDGKMLSVESTGDAQASASIAEAPTYKEWDFSRSTVTGCTDYFYIYVNGTSHACLSHNGGFAETDKLGIWASGWNTNDGGTLFKFVEAEFDNDNARYYQLSDFENTLEYQTAITPEGTTVGAFDNGDAYSTAYTTASNLITAGNTSDATACKEAYTALRTASESVARIEPEEGKIYRIYITPGYTASDRTGASMRIDDNGKLYCDTYAESNARFYFTFEYDDDGNLYMKNLHSATYLDEALNSTDNKNVQVGADAEDIANAKKIAINTLGKSGEAVVVGIVPDGGNMLNCAGKPGNVIAFDNTNVDKASAWVIEEVEPTTLEENVKHTVTLGNNTVGDDLTTAYSSLCLGYPVTLPSDANVVAYTVTTEPDLESVVQLTSIAGPGETIPANTPVILKGTTNNGTTCTLSFAVPTDAVATVDAATNLLGGTTYAKYLSCFEGDENVYNIYMLTRKNGLMAMRWVYENYQLNDDGTYSKVANANSNDGGYVLCPANKAYLKLGGVGASLSAEYFFSFFDTTDIDTVESEKNPLDGTIYDLQGRKIDEVTTAGFYIVNGEKLYVNPEMLK